VGRDCRSDDSRTSPLLYGVSDVYPGAALVELLRESTDVDDGVCVGEVGALGRALVWADASAGESTAVAAMVSKDPARTVSISIKF
jgi:hypothetical protein